LIVIIDALKQYFNNTFNKIFCKLKNILSVCSWIWHIMLHMMLLQCQYLVFFGWLERHSSILNWAGGWEVSRQLLVSAYEQVHCTSGLVLNPKFFASLFQSRIQKRNLQVKEELFYVRHFDSLICDFKIPRIAYLQSIFVSSLKKCLKEYVKTSPISNNCIHLTLSIAYSNFFTRKP